MGNDPVRGYADDGYAIFRNVLDPELLATPGEHCPFRGVEDRG